MTRDDIKKQFDGATDEQIKTLLDINSADIGKAKKGGEDLAAQLKAAQEALTAAKTTIGELEKTKGDTAALQAEVDKYKAAEAKRADDEKKAAAHAELSGRFDKALGECKFAHEYIRSGVLSDFEKALADEKNKGKGDAEIFDALTKDKDGIFASQNRMDAANMGGMGGGKSEVDSAQAREIMGLPPKK